MYVVILAGGGGTRLRPLSRDDRPKPFLPLIDDRTLIQHTVDRLPSGLSGVFVVADGRYGDLLRTQVPHVELIAEPVGRNTAAAIALATLAIDRPDNEVMIVLPADHAIEKEERFADVLDAAGRHLVQDVFGVSTPLVTLGVQVAGPSTEYGYLIPVVERGADVAGLQAYPLCAFQEKPDVDRARELARQPGVAWNAGMFLWQRGAIRAALSEFTPLTLALEGAIGKRDALAAAYGALHTRSIDYEVMEPSAAAGRVVMASMDVGWNDIGGWTALLAQIGASGIGRVLQQGETTDIGGEDLAILAREGRLVIQAGPSTIRSDGTVALLSGAAADRERVEQLLARVAAKEAQQP